MIKFQSLGEMHFGAWERHQYASIASKWQTIYEKWIKTPAKVQIPSGESFMDFCERVRSFSVKLNEFKNQPVAVVAHGGSLAVLAMILLRKPLNQFWKWVPGVASVTILQRDRNGSFQCVKFNDQSHLKSWVLGSRRFGPDRHES
jgi:alpha-ribazole phosphatase